MKRIATLLAVLPLMPIAAAAWAADMPGSSDLIEKGRQIAVAADCAACHTAPEGRPFAGGYPVQTPLGTIYSTNITPSVKNGIGAYDEAAFARAVREGVKPDGTHLYPAMPYPAYSGITDADLHALYVYFKSAVAPEDVSPPKTDLGFPFNIRASMILWNMLYLPYQRFAPKAEETPQIARGRYLVDTLEHCGTCHTPRGLMMGPQSGKDLGGAQLGAWVAPNITPDLLSGIGTWSDEALASYLKTGVAAHLAQAAGPMGEVVEHSTQYLPDADIQAMIAYLRHVPSVKGQAVHPRSEYGAQGGDEASLRGLTSNVDLGWKTFSGVCATCHQVSGQGRNQYPALFHNTVTGADSPDNLVATILFGVRRTVDGQTHYMPGFGDAAAWTDQLSDAQIAAVANYVFKQYGNPSMHVSASDVAKERNGGSLASSMQKFLSILGGVFALVVVVGLLALLVRRKRA